MKFMKQLRRSLLLRVALIALVSGLSALLGVLVTLGTFAAAPTNLKAALVIGVIVVLPIFLGWLTSILVGRPLRHFAQAITLLKDSNYRTELQTPNIAEFDTIFSSFNDLAKRLRHEEDLRKNLISDTSHELNTPLTAMSGQLIAMQEGRLPITKERIDTLKEQADQLADLIRGLHTYTQARLPQDALVKDIKVAKECCQLIKEIVPEAMDVSIDITQTLLVRGNPAAFRQIIRNLLQNTLRYAKASSIHIAANERNLTFADNGQGVPTDSLPHLFERFYRVEKSRNRTTGGLGLGLAIVKELAERQGWKIRVEDAKPGLRFIVTFRT